MDPFTCPRIFQSSAKTVSYCYLCYRSPGDTLCSISPGVSLSWLSPGGTGMGGTLPGAGHQPSTECPLPFLLLLLLSRLKGPWNKEQSAELFSQSFPWSCWNILPMGMMSLAAFWEQLLESWGRTKPPKVSSPRGGDGADAAQRVFGPGDCPHQDTGHKQGSPPAFGQGWRC